MPLFGCCIRKVVDVKSLDYRHSGLSNVPNAVFNAVHTIETLYLDSNQIKSLPRELFHCHGLRSLTLSDNEITSFPAAISSLTNLEKLDVSKNGIVELPDNLKTLKYLSVLDSSVNPLGKLPEGFTQLLNLTQVCLNDCFLEWLPGNFGRLSNLKILELRENHLKTLPQSLSRLTELERLDIGCNEFTELPGSVVGTLRNLLELWCDSNQITSVPKEIGNLKHLMYFDACKNRIGELPDEIDGCISLSDLHLSTNLLKVLPLSIGRLSNITTLKVDDNQLVSLPSSIGGLVSLSELDVSANDLEEIPPTIGLLRHLRTLIADENFLSDIPCELGSCSGLTVLSVRSNKLTYLPDEIGRIPRLRVLTLSDNEIKTLPYSLMNLKELQALWLAENQSKALIRLQSAIDPETQRRCLTCYLLPQQRMDPVDSYGGDDNQSFHPSLWEEQRQQRVQIQFEDNEPHEATHEDGSAYPKEMRVMSRHVQNEAIRKSTSNDKDLEHDENGLLLGSESEPKIATHRLVKLEKEKQAKDRARINRQSQEINPEDVKLSLSAPPHKKHSHKHKERRNSKGSERDIEQHPQQTPTSAKKLNGSLKNMSQTYDTPTTPQNKPRVIQNGHYAASPARAAAEHRQHAAEVQRSSSIRSSGLTHSQTFPVNNAAAAPIGSQRSLRGQPHDRYLSSLQNDNPDVGHAPINTSQRNVSSDTRGSNPRLPSQQNNSQQILNSEDTFGIFASDEDPKLYQRRFKYYQRMRKHRKNPEVKSDLGYYNDQYGSGSTKAQSESGRHRRPLQQGRDGFDQWERYSQRSVGDGYASDVEGFNYAGKRMHHVSNHMQSPYRPTSQKSYNISRHSVNEHRPAVPPSYNTAMAKRTDGKQVENTVFPPPPPYKPPPRDQGPDGASNDGVPRSSPTHDEDVPFKSYSEAEKLQRANVININDTLPKQDPQSTSTPVVQQTGNSRPPPPNHRPDIPPNHRPDIPPNHRPDIRNSMPSSYYSPIENYNERAPVRRNGSNPQRRDSTNNPQQRPQVQQRSSFYDSNYQEDTPVDTEYAAQISKSLGRLGYNRESDKRLARPPPQFSGDPNETVPPPALFSGAQNEGQSNMSKSAGSELYGVVGTKNGSGLNGSGNYAIPNSYTPSAQRRSYHQQPTTPTSSRHNLSNGHLANQSNYSYLPPPTRKSPKLPHKQMMPPTGIELEQNTKIMNITIIKNPGLGFSVAGGVGLQGNPYKPHDEGIFVTKLHANGAATNILHPGDKILSVNGQDFTHMEHNSAVASLKQQPTRVAMVIERMLKPTDV